MLDAPAPIEQKQLDELCLQTKQKNKQKRAPMNHQNVPP